LYILAAAFLWGITGVYVKELAARGAETIQIVMLRSSIALLGLGLWLLFKNRKAFRIRFNDIWCFFGTGVLSLLLFNCCYFMAVQEIGMAVASVLLYTAPAIVAVLSAFLFKEKLKLSGWGILVMVLLGCALVSGVVSAVSAFSLTGALFGLGAGLGYALYSVFGRYALMKGYSPQTISFYTFAFCSVGCIPVLLAAPVSNIPVLVSDPVVWLLALALGICSCLFPFLLYIQGLAGVTGATASMTATLEPVVAVLFGIFLYREILTVWQGAGIVMVLSGIILLAKTNS